MKKSVKELRKELNLKPELYSLTAINPFANHNSASRSLMLSSHIAAALTLIDGDEAIVQSGIERELGKQTLNVNIKNDSKVIEIIPRYSMGLDQSCLNKIVDVLLIFEDLVTGEIDCVEVPYSSSFHTYFGFKYNWDHETLNNLAPNDILKAGTVVADSPAVTKNKGYKFGAMLNVAMVTVNESAEDAVVVSESAAKKLTTNVYDKRSIEFGSNSFMLNLYGDEDNYKPFPEIGEYLKPSGALVAIRDYVDGSAASLTGKKDIMDFNPIFDNVVYVRGGKSKVVDIKVYRSPEAKKEVYSGTDELVNKYADAYIKYLKEIVDLYEKLTAEYIRKYHVDGLKISNRLTRIITDAMVIMESDNIRSDRKISKVHRKKQLDIYRVEFVIESTLSVVEGFKITDKHGGKSIVVQVRKDEDMPTDKDGVRADIQIDPAATISRMNIGRLYEAYMGAASRKVKKIIIDLLNNNGYTDPTIADDDVINTAYGIVCDFLSIIGTEQGITYANVTDVNIKREVITEVYNKELYIYYHIGAEVTADKIVANIEKSKYRPLTDKVTMNNYRGKVESDSDVTIAPMHIMLLAKIADTWLATSGAKINHFNLPTSTSRGDKYRLPFRNNATKVLSETEGRVYSSYVDPKFLIELKDRGSSVEAHKDMYLNILNADNPSNMDYSVDRSKVPYGGDQALKVVRQLFNSTGMDFKYTSEGE